MTKRKREYPSAKNNRRPPFPGGSSDTVDDRPSLARVNVDARAGKAGFSVGDRVVISGSGLYSGETAVIERLSAGAIPSALVRTEAGNTRQVRTIDLHAAQTETRPAQ
jgi:hypothetical protein